MKKLVKVVNKGKVTYKEEFKDKTYVVKPNGFIILSRRDAIQFLGSVGTSSIEKGIEKNFEIEDYEDEVLEVEEKEDIEGEFVSNVDGKKFRTQEELDKHLNSFDPNTLGAETLVDDEVDTTKRSRKAR